MGSPYRTGSGPVTKGPPPDGDEPERWANGDVAWLLLLALFAAGGHVIKSMAGGVTDVAFGLAVGTTLSCIALLIPIARDALLEHLRARRLDD